MRRLVLAAALLCGGVSGVWADPSHCAAVRASHPTISIETQDGKRRYQQYGQTTCECLLTVAAQHLPQVLVQNMKDNHRRGAMLAVGDPAIKGTLLGDLYYAQLEALGERKLRRYDRALIRQCGTIFPARLS